MSTQTHATAISKEYIASLPLYIPGKAISAVARELAVPEESILKLASNENPLGLSEGVRKALAALTQSMDSCYPDPAAVELKQHLGTHYGVRSDAILVGSGSDEILTMAARAFAGAGDRVLLSQYAFASYYLAAASVGATPVVVPAENYGHALDAMLDAIDAQTRLIYLANPNNPTGTFWKIEEICRFLDGVPEQVAVVLDEAYAEYLPDALQSSPARLIERYGNLVVTRTFSKIYGLASLRVGYAIATPEMIALLNRVRSPFNTGIFAQKAAVAALQDQAFVQQSRALNAQGREQLYAGFARLGLEFLPSQGNFVLVKVGNGAETSQRLLQRSIIVRPVANYGLPEWLRISVGLPAQNERLLAEIQQVI
jgi:histidinol-phosphate aminotransferase